MSLNPKQKQILKAKAHRLKPIVQLGNNGLTENVIKEINRALTDHELIKIRIQSEDREERRSLFNQVAEAAEAQLVQVIGSIGVFYRPKQE